LAEADCVVIATDHSAYDWGEIASKASLVVATRRVV
jgi:UDP-N-acetyl-D-mannosaminuronate dehydrogenase